MNQTSATNRRLLLAERPTGAPTMKIEHSLNAGESVMTPSKPDPKRRSVDAAKSKAASKYDEVREPARSE